MTQQEGGKRLLSIVLVSVQNPQIPLAKPKDLSKMVKVGLKRAKNTKNVILSILSDFSKNLFLGKKWDF